MFFSSQTDNIIAALEQNNRVRKVDLWDLEGWQLEQVLTAMRAPLPQLAVLRLISGGETVPVIPDSFLDGSAPRLRYFSLDGIPFPGLPSLLLSATHLVSLWLESIPHSGYFSPEPMVSLLSILSSLEELSLQFESPRSCPDGETRAPPPSERSVIPALHHFCFKGVVEYLEDLVTDIDIPKLDHTRITFFNSIDFNTPRLARFINRTPKLGKRDATVLFSDGSAAVELSGSLQIEISCLEPDWQLSSIEQVCNSFWDSLSTVEYLYIDHRYRQLVWKDDAIENILWLQLLLPFTAVKYLYLSKEFAPGIATTLQELDGDRITEVLPSLRSIYVEWLEPSGPVQEGIGQFIAARQLSDHTITVSHWNISRRG